MIVKSYDDNKEKYKKLMKAREEYDKKIAEQKIIKK